MHNLVWLVVLVAITYGVYCAERRGRRMVAVHVVLAAAILDGVLFPKGGGSNGIFLPVAKQSWIVLLPPALLAARWLAGQGRRFVMSPALAGLAAFLGWTLAETVAGFLGGHPSHYVLLESKPVVTLGLTAVLVAGTSAEELTARSGIRALAWAAAPFALLVVGATEAKFVTSQSFGLFHGVETGTMGSDVATLFATIGVLALAVALASPRGQRAVILPGLVLIAAPAFTGQRASLLAVAAAIVLVLLAALFGAGRVLRVTGREAGAVVLAVGLLLGGTAIASAASGGISLSGSRITQSFTSQGKQDSASSRINQWQVASKLAVQEPVTGHGLGTTYHYVELVKDAPDNYVESDLTHDIFLDELLRGGLVAVLLLVVAFGSAIACGFAAYRRSSGPLLAALAGAAAAGLVGLLVRGSVESIFEKERLCPLMGLLFGLVHVAWTTHRHRLAVPSRGGLAVATPREELVAVSNGIGRV